MKCKHFISIVIHHFKACCNLGATTHISFEEEQCLFTRTRNASGKTELAKICSQNWISSSPASMSAHLQDVEGSNPLYFNFACPLHKIRANLVDERERYTPSPALEANLTPLEPGSIIIVTSPCLASGDRL